MNSEILENVLKEFEKLAAIPRKSGHEKAVSDFLKGYLEELGFQTVQDEVFNIIADKPASAGFEKAPLVILQGHMDMVCVAEEGYDYDPLRDPIKLRRTEEYLEAEGTSLGSDDGIGVAEAIYILKTMENHGPLRLIVTVDEEQGMKGAIHLDRRYLEDAVFLINCDSENYDELTVGSAGSVNLDFSRKMKCVPPHAGHAWIVGAKGLKGGHSGERIGDGRGNALRTLAAAIRAIQKKGEVELVSFDGGKARNAIPSDARAVFVSDIPKAEIQAVLAEQEQRFRQMYGAADEGRFLLEETGLPEEVFVPEDTLALLRLIQIIHSGVYAMSQAVPGLVETSANLGVIGTEGNRVFVQCMPRSASDQKIDEFCRTAEDWAALTGFDLQIGTKSPGWKENKNSRMARLMEEIFQEQNGKPMKVGTIHAGLECGWHFCKNPSLDIVSIGVTTQEIHSPRERLVLSTVEPQVRLICEALRRIAKYDK